MKSAWETYKNQRIFYAHYEYLNPDEYKIEINEVEKELIQQPFNSVLCLINISGLPANPEVLDEASKVASKLAKHMHRVALIGLGDSAYFKFLLNTVYRFSGMHIVPFNDEQLAKDWLTR